MVLCDLNLVLRKPCDFPGIEVICVSDSTEKSTSLTRVQFQCNTLLIWGQVAEAPHFRLSQRNLRF